METLFDIQPPLSYYLLIAIGVWLRITIRIRRAKRRGAGGLQHFTSVFAFLFIPFMERLLWLAANAAIIGRLLGWWLGKR